MAILPAIERYISSLVSRYYMAGLLLLLLFTVIAGASAWGIYRISLDASKNLMETRAVDIAVNVNFTLEQVEMSQDLFQRLLKESKWDDVAFIALIDREGTVLLHSNPRLAGKEIRDDGVEVVFRTKQPQIGWSRLATGERVFVMDYPITALHRQLGRDGAGSGGTSGEEMFCLRVVLHPYPAQRIVRKAYFQLVTISVAILTLWLAALFFLLTWRRKEKLQAMLNEREHMARLGEMAAVLAHEIRNPLSTIKGFAQYNLESTKDKDLAQDLSLIVKEAGRLEELSQNLLVYCRPLSVNHGNIWLPDLCQELEIQTRHLGFHGYISMKCQEATFVSDREKLLRIAMNLINNAVDAVRDQVDGLVEVHIGRAEDGLVMRVADNGPGIRPDLRPKLFEPFVTGKVKGSGLGLAIVQRLVQALGGAVSLETGEETGTVFTVFIPEAAKAASGEEE